MTDPKKIAEIHARTRPNADGRDSSPGPEQEWDERSLPLGGRVHEFEITGIIGKGGFGIVYLAWDHSLERAVALKEYMPASFASRNSRSQVSPLSERHRETFQMGLNSFVNEAKLLAQFHSPSLVEVHRFWEDNGTAYMVMPYYRGLTLGETVRAFAAPPDENWLLDLLGPVTEALMELHSVNCYHRDVAPDNILILSDTGAPLLLDFGAARRVIVGQVHALTIILKAGYAPIEQYGDLPGVEQGPWTDVYALASVVYWAVTGKTPPPATSRAIRDTYIPLAECAAGQYSPNFLTAIDRALVLMPEGRTDSIATMRSELGLSPLTMRKAATAIRWADPDATMLAPPTVRNTARPAAPPAPAVAPSVAAAPTVAPARAVTTPAVTAPAAAAAPAAPAPRKLPLAAALGAAALVAAVGGGIWMFGSGKDTPAPAPPVAARGDSPPVTAPAPVVPAPVPVVPEPVPVVAAPPPVVADVIPVPQSAAAALALIVARRDPALAVAVDSGGPAGRTLSYTASAPGHAYVLGLDANKDALMLLLPARGAAGAPGQASGKLALPVAGLPPGAWKFALVLARDPVDLASHGWVAQGKAWTRKFAGADAAKDLLPWTLTAPYGAAAFELDIAAAPVPEAVKPPKPSAPIVAERAPAKPPKAPPNPECQKILMQMSLGEAGQDLIERMKTLKCN